MNPIDLIVALIVMAGLLVNRQPLIPVGAMGVVLLRGSITRLTKGIGFKKVEWALVLCLSYWIANYFWSTRSLSNFISYDFLRHEGSMLISYAIFIFFLGWPLKPSQCRGFWTLFLVSLSGIAIAGAALSLNLPYSGMFKPLQVVGHENAVGGDMFFGWYEAHNTAGGVYAIASVLALLWVQEPKLGWKEKLFRWGVLGCCALGLAFTYSRGAYLAFLAGAVVVLPWRNLRQTMKIIMMVGVPVVLLILSTSSVLDRIDTISDPYYGTNASRTAMWVDALRDFGDSPLIGIGYGRYNDIYEHFEGVKHIVWVAYKGIIVNDDSHAHNSYLQFLAEGGIVGFLLTMFVWWSAWKELAFFESHFPRSRLRLLEKGARACLVVALAAALTEHIMGRGSVVLILDAMIGITLASARLEAKAAKAAVPKEPLDSWTWRKALAARARSENLAVR